MYLLFFMVNSPSQRNYSSTEQRLESLQYLANQYFRLTFTFCRASKMNVCVAELYYLRFTLVLVEQRTMNMRILISKYLFTNLLSERTTKWRRMESINEHEKIPPLVAYYSHSTLSYNCCSNWLLLTTNCIHKNPGNSMFVYKTHFTTTFAVHSRDFLLDCT